MSDDKLIPVKVAVRIRPLSKKENNEGCQTVVEVVENEPQVYVLSFKPELRKFNTAYKIRDMQSLGLTFFSFVGPPLPTHLSLCPTNLHQYHW